MKKNHFALTSIIFLTKPTGLSIMVYATGLVEMLGVSVHFAEMFLGRVGSFSAMITGKQMANLQLLGIAFGVGLLFSFILYMSILVLKIYKRTKMADWFSFFFACIALLTYGTFIIGQDLAHGAIYGLSAFFIVLICAVGGREFTSILAKMVVEHPKFQEFQTNLIDSVFDNTSNSRLRPGRRTR